MKESLVISAVCFFLAVTLTSCLGNESGSVAPQSTCTSSEDNLSRTVNFFDYTFGSPYAGKVVAVFQFKQKSTKYSGTACNGKLIECKNSLTIQNTTNKTITFDYNVAFSLNAVVWSYQNVSTIAPNSTIDIGSINSNCASIELGSFALRAVSINYR